MDQNQSNGSTSSSRTSYWTNERHGHFLNSLEASFVRNMFGKHDVDDDEDRRLDRVLPDSAESTLDLGSGNGRRRGHSSTGNFYVRSTSDHHHIIHSFIYSFALHA